jgi:hypothetical protein
MKKAKCKSCNHELISEWRVFCEENCGCKGCSFERQALILAKESGW